MEDFGRGWEGLVLHGAAVFVHRDRNLCCERGRDLVPGPDFSVPKGVEMRRYQRGCVCANYRRASGVGYVGVEG